MDTSERSSVGLSANVAAGIAVLFSYISGMIMLSLEHRSSYVRFYAYQSVCATPVLVLSGLAELTAKAMGFLGANDILAMLFDYLGKLLFIAFAVVYVIMLFSAFSGKLWALPLGIGAWCKRRAGIS